MLNGRFQPPVSLIQRVFVADPLTVADAPLDHAAYVASPEVIQTHSDGRWPIENFTVEQNAQQIAAHERDRSLGRAFAYMLRHPTRSESLGCVYFNPLHEYLSRACADPVTLATFPRASAMVTFWVRQDLQSGRLPKELVLAVDRWVSEVWPIDAHVFRVLPAELSSRHALKQSGLQPLRLTLHCEPRPYEWYRGSPSK